MPLRKSSTVWAAVEDERKAANTPQKKWKQSYKGVSAALKSLGLQLVTSEEEFATLSIPIVDRGTHTGKNYGSRKIIVERDGVRSKLLTINTILSGGNSLLTPGERQQINLEVGVRASERTGKGLLTTNRAETIAIEELDSLIESAKVLDRAHILEFRAADVGYKLTACEDDNWVGEQVKTAIGETHACVFSHSSQALRVGNMLEVLKCGMTLTCIGLTRDRAVDVVWLFHGQDAVQMLQSFDTSQRFCPMLHLKFQLAKCNAFTQAISDKQYRFDVGQSKEECSRLLQRKVEIATTGIKRTLQFLNEDISQIASKDHWTEQLSFNLTRDACLRMGAVAERLHEDAYTLVDFRVSIARIQDKVRTRTYGNRHPGCHPYHPDKLDVLQVTCLDDSTVCAFPMRIVRNDKVESFFTVEELMKCFVSTRNIWKTNNAEFMHDFSTEEGARSYVAACEAAARVPPLTNQNFYQNMIDANQHEFGSRKQLQKRKADAELVRDAV